MRFNIPNVNGHPALYPNPKILAGDIDPEAMDVVRRIAQSGGNARFVGGCVRDLLLGRRPTDFDVVTPLSLRRVRRIFGRHARAIGRRHRLVHVWYRNGKIIEVSTYPAPETQTPDRAKGEVLDARRRDFTINALYYDPIGHSLIDHVQGYEDIRSRVIRSIGSPRESFREDPVRILRGIRYASLLDLRIEDETWKAMVELAPTVAGVNKARMQEEIWKFLLRTGTHRAFRIFADLGVFAALFPDLTSFLDPERPSHIWEYLAAKDGVPKEDLTQTLALAILLLPLLDELEVLGPKNLDKDSERLAARCRETIERLGDTYSLAHKLRHEVVALLDLQLYLLRGPDAVRASKRSEGGRRSPVDSPRFAQALRVFRVLIQARGLDGGMIAAWETEAQRRRAEPRPGGSAPRRKRRRRRRNRSRPPRRA